MSWRADGSWYGPSRGRAAANPDLRVGDAERNEVAQALSQHYSAGRLDDTELQERIDRAMSAKTGKDLAGLLTDLPPLHPDPSTQSRAVPEVPRHRRTGLWVAVVVVLLLMSMPFSAPWHGQWMWYPRIPWLLVGAAAFFLWRRSRHRHWRSGRTA